SSCKEDATCSSVTRAVPSSSSSQVTPAICDGKRNGPQSLTCSSWRQQPSTIMRSLTHPLECTTFAAPHVVRPAITNFFERQRYVIFGACSYFTFVWLSGCGSTHMPYLPGAGSASLTRK